MADLVRGREEEPSERRVRPRLADADCLELLSTVLAKVEGLDTQVKALRAQINILTQSSLTSSLTLEEEHFVRLATKRSILNPLFPWSPSDQDIRTFIVADRAVRGIEGVSRPDLPGKVVSFCKQILREEKDRIRKQLFSIGTYQTWQHLQLRALSSAVISAVVKHTNISNNEEAQELFDKKLLVLRLVWRHCDATGQRVYWESVKKVAEIFDR